MDEARKKYAVKKIEEELKYFIKEPCQINYNLTAENLASQIDWEKDSEFLHKGFSWLVWKYKTQIYDVIYSS